MPTTKLAKQGWKLIFLAIAAFYLFGLGALPLVGPDEPRYAQVAREMAARHDLITPTLGGHPWFEKPALLYWLMMASYRVLGVNEYAARLPPALCGLLTGAFLFWLARSVTRTSGTQSRANHFAHWSALVFLSSLGAIAFSRAASFDIVLTMTVTGALCCFFRSRLKPEKKNVLFAAFYFFVGLSLLAKGLVGVILPFGILAGFFLMHREWPGRKFMISLVWGLPFVTAVAALWYGPMIQRYGWLFIDQFIIQHHFARFLSNKYHHPQPFYFYLPTIAWLSVPWTLLLIRGIGRRALKLRKTAPIDDVLSLALAWILIPTLFFSLSGAKLPGYILPVLPGAALLVGNEIRRYLDGTRNLRIMRVTAASMMAISVGGAWYAARHFSIPFPLITAELVIAFLAGGMALIFSRPRIMAPAMLAFASLAIAAIAISAARYAVAPDSTRDLIRAADARGYAESPVFYLLCDDRTAEFYAGGRLAYAANGEPMRFEGAQDLAAAVRQQGGLGMVLIETRWEKQLTDYRAVETEKIADNGWISIFAVRVR